MATRKLCTVSSNRICVRHKSTKGYLPGRLRHLKLLSSRKHRSNSSALFLTVRPRSILHEPMGDTCGQIQSHHRSKFLRCCQPSGRAGDLVKRTPHTSRCERLPATKVIKYMYELMVARTPELTMEDPFVGPGIGVSASATIHADELNHTARSLVLRLQAR